MSDNFAAQLAAFKRMGSEERNALWMAMAMMDRDNIKTTMYLNQERMQYSLGKTEKALQFASQHYYGNYYNSNEKDHNLCLIVTNNSLAETEQWKVRVGKKFRSLNIAIFSSKFDANFNKIDSLISSLSTSLPKDLPHIIILCCHPQRIKNDIPKLLEFTKKTIRVDGIRYITNLIFDEVDKTENLNLVVNLVNKLPTYEYVQDIIWITATPLKEFWKTLRKNGIRELANIDNKLDDIPDRISLNSQYCKITDHNHINVSNRPTLPVQYVTYILNETNHINLDERNVLFVPAENNTKSHAKMVELLNEKGFIVLIHNGKYKEFRFPGGEVTTIFDFNKIYSIKGELRDTLRKLNELYPTTSIAITGMRTLERGITMNTDGFNFTHMIISDYHAKKLNALLQLMGRSAGHVDFVRKMNIICSETIWNHAVEFNKNMEQLKTLSPDMYTAEDFIDFTRKRTEHEPIIIKFKDQDIARTFYKKKMKPELGGNGPRRRKLEKDGNYQGKYCCTIRGDKHVYSTEEIIHNKGWGLNAQQNLFRFYPCYVDINDDSTLEFWYTIYVGENIKNHPLYKYNNKCILEICENW